MRHRRRRDRQVPAHLVRHRIRIAPEAGVQRRASDLGPETNGWLPRVEAGLTRNSWSTTKTMALNVCIVWCSIWYSYIANITKSLLFFLSWGPPQFLNFEVKRFHRATISTNGMWVLAPSPCELPETATIFTALLGSSRSRALEVQGHIPNLSWSTVRFWCVAFQPHVWNIQTPWKYGPPQIDQVNPNDPPVMTLYFDSLELKRPSKLLCP